MDDDTFDYSMEDIFDVLSEEDQQAYLDYLAKKRLELPPERRP